MSAIQGKGDDEVKAESDDESVKSDITMTSSKSARGKKGEKGWSGLQTSVIESCEQGVVHKQQECNHGFTILEDQFILDTGSSFCGTFMNPDLLVGVRVAKQPINMTTNAGMKRLGLEGLVNGFGKSLL